MCDGRNYRVALLKGKKKIAHQETKRNAGIGGELFRVMDSRREDIFDRRGERKGNIGKLTHVPRRPKQDVPGKENVNLMGNLYNYLLLRETGGNIQVLKERVKKKEEAM